MHAWRWLGGHVRAANGKERRGAQGLALKVRDRECQVEEGGGHGEAGDWGLSSVGGRGRGEWRVGR